MGFSRLPFERLSRETRRKYKGLSRTKVEEIRKKSYDRAREYIENRFKVEEDIEIDEFQRSLINFVNNEFTQVKGESLIAFNSQVVKPIIDYKREEIIEDRKKREYVYKREGIDIRVRKWNKREMTIALKDLPIKHISKILDRTPRSIYNLRYRFKKSKK